MRDVSVALGILIIAFWFGVLAICILMFPIMNEMFELRRNNKELLEMLEAEMLLTKK